ncbi:glycosyltransferase [Bradyrhizobium sp. CCBAU 11361]|uniref:glycosyltransferase n=1 Tax=Bradyrhizobium sp. CCBAU 11361 TaxID=1630812 RepID=UPI00230699AC|nr:glycosyltransferase [Bradyrhizobium sp. CCBAU 11361]
MQNNRTDSWINRGNGPPEFRPGPVVSLPEVLAVLAFIRRHLPIVSLTCFAALGVATLYLVIAVPTFIAKALLIVNSNATLLDAAAVSTVLESQIEIIKSESIASAVIETLGLAQDPEFATGQGSGTISRLFGWSKPATEVSAARYALDRSRPSLSALRILSRLPSTPEIPIERRRCERTIFWCSSENLRMTVIEALAHGATVVCTPVGALPELIEYERTRLIVEPGDVERLASALRRLIDDPELRQRLGGNGRTQHRTRLAIEICAERLVAIWTEPPGER